MEKQKKAAGLQSQTAFATTLNPINTSTENQRAIVLDALMDGPKTTIELRHNYGIMQPAPRIKELRDSGHNIISFLMTCCTPDGVKHFRVAKYILRGANGC